MSEFLRLIVIVIKMGETCDYKDLIYDEACVIVNNNIDSKAWLYSLSSDCDSCPFSLVGEITRGKNQSFKFKTDASLTWRIKNEGVENISLSTNTSDVRCELIPNLDQFGIYQLNVEATSCSVDNVKEPTSLYIPLLVCTIVLICLIGMSSFLPRCMYAIRKRLRKANGTREVDLPVDKSTPKRRVKSIDTFRGISILMMIFVNDGAGGYRILEHATWDGLLVGDLVFPCFMWIMGVCLPITIGSQLSRQVPRLTLCMGVLKRSLVLFLLGISLNTLGTSSQLERIRVFGVLQRFSVVYFLVAVSVVLLTKRKRVEPKSQYLRAFKCVLVLLPHWTLFCGIVALHCVITFHLPVPSCPTGYLGPGGLHKGGNYSKCTGGAAGYIDRLILGVNHIYQHPTIDNVYGSGPFDPEGILGCLSSMFQVFLGVQAGIILRYHKKWQSHMARWIGWSILLAVIGLSLHFTKIVPINKNLWSMSFVLVTSGFAFLLLTVCYFLVDVIEFWKGGPFRIPGMNALLIYVGHQLCYEIFPFHWKYGDMKTHAWQLIESIWGVLLWTLIAYYLHHKKVYLSL